MAYTQAELDLLAQYPDGTELYQIYDRNPELRVPSQAELDAQEAAATQKESLKGTAGYDEWRLYAGDQTLGSKDQAANLLSRYETETSLRTDQWGNQAQLTKGQWDAFQRYIGEAENSGWETTELNSTYGINPPTNTNIIDAFVGLEDPHGYTPAGINRVEDYYTDQYGTAEGFSEAELPGALTRVYGELQGQTPMGLGWMDMYHTYNKWEQEDEMWRQEMLGVNEELFPKALAQQRAQMAAGGMESGTEQWKRNQAALEGQRVDIEQQYAEKQKALSETSVHGALKSQYEEMRELPEMRGIEKTETLYRDVSTWADEIDKYTGAQYGRDSETGEQILINEGYWSTTPGHYDITSEPYENIYTQGTETGRLLYGTDEAKTVAPSFDEFFQGQFGLASGVANPYEAKGVSNQPETEEDKRAKMAASGAEMV